ncbi:MAG: rRNA maturation RNase YbeY [Candidatus Omnitrophica bacterium]|nr:rRNA maturation RNase YbeY [Candidatus Omnitrophota bacterium]
MNRILIRNWQKKMPVNRRKLEKTARRVLEAEGVDGAELSILVVDDAHMAVFNRQYRGKNRPTDVLAFRLQDAAADGVHPELLGDVVISAETARRTAAEVRATADEELALYLIHGILHLLGYDDTRSAPARAMNRRQKELLAQYG